MNLPQRHTTTPPAPVVDHAAVTAAAIVKIRAGVPESTRRAYAAARADWLAWCADPGVDTPPYPVTPEVLARYVTHLLDVGSYLPPVDAHGNPRPRRPLAVATVEQRLAAISTGSVEAGRGRPDQRAARLVIRGHKRTVGVQRRKAAPMTRRVLRAFVAQAMTHHGKDGRPSLRALRDRALVLASFATMARRSDATGLALHHIEEDPGGEGLVIQMLRRKTSDDAKPVRVPHGSDAELCPVRAIRAYVERLRELGVTTGSLFRSVNRWDHPGAKLSGEAASEIIARLARDAGVRVPDGFGQWSGHSARRGGATEARRNGADRLQIARHGGWSDRSSALDEYLEDVDGWANNPMKGVL